MPILNKIKATLDRSGYVFYHVKEDDGQTFKSRWNVKRPVKYIVVGTYPATEVKILTPHKNPASRKIVGLYKDDAEMKKLAGYAVNRFAIKNVVAYAVPSKYVTIKQA